MASLGFRYGLRGFPLALSVLFLLNDGTGGVKHASRIVVHLLNPDEDLFADRGTPNFATYGLVMSLIPRCGAGSSPMRTNLFHTMAPALQGCQLDTITPSARPWARYSLSVMRPAR